MIRVFLLCALSICVFSVAWAQTPPPVGTVSGDWDYIDADPTPVSGRGERLRAGAYGGVGSYSLDTGETLTLNAGGGDPGRTRRPAMIVGGLGGTGTVTLSNGSTLELFGDNGGPSIFIGEEGLAGNVSNGFVNVLSGSTLFMEDLGLLDIDSSIGENGVKINVGRVFGNGTLSFDDGNLIMRSTSRVQLTAGDENDAMGTLSFSNGSTALLEEVAGPGATPNGAELVVGSDGSTGSMAVSNSDFTLRSNVDSARVKIGRNSGNGSLNVTGASSVMNVEASNLALVEIGLGGSGDMTINSNATVNVTTTGGGESLVAIGQLRSGEDVSSSGALNVLGGATLNVGPLGLFEVGESNARDAGSVSNAAVTISGAGSQINVSDRTVVGKVSGDHTTTAIVNVSNGGTLVSPTVDIFDGGSIVGSGGTVLGDVSVFAGGALAPGLSPGLLTIDGDLRLGAGSSLFMEFDGSELGEFDQIDVSGELFVDGMFDLVLDFTEYRPVDGATFSFLNVGGAFGESFFDFANISLLGLGDDSVFSLAKSSSGSGISLTATSVSAIPLPMPAFMLLTGLFGFAAIRKSRKAA